MLRALLGLILGFLIVSAAAVAYGKWNDMSAMDFQPILIGAMIGGAVLGALIGLLTRRKTG
jgi:hypothetical protein